MTERLNEFITKQEALVEELPPYGIETRQEFLRQNSELLAEYSDIREEINTHFGVTTPVEEPPGE